MRPLATRLARVIGLAVLLYSPVIFLGNIVGALGGAVSDTPWLSILVIAVGAVGREHGLLAQPRRTGEPEVDWPPGVDELRPTLKSV